MADITMCPGANLPQCSSCYRMLAKESKNQSYFVEAPAEQSDCSFYWEVDKAWLSKNSKSSDSEVKKIAEWLNPAGSDPSDDLANCTIFLCFSRSTKNRKRKK